MITNYHSSDNGFMIMFIDGPITDGQEVPHDLPLGTVIKKNGKSYVISETIRNEWGLNMFAYRTNSPAESFSDSRIYYIMNGHEWYIDMTDYSTYSHPCDEEIFEARRNSFGPLGYQVGQYL